MDTGDSRCFPLGKEKEENWRMSERIVIDPTIQHGKPVIRGTRVPMTRIIGGLAGGMTKEEMIRECEVTQEDIEALWPAFFLASCSAHS
jgi:uncharacterized protein (DUF433 family)